jgi:hypothetical protein
MIDHCCVCICAMLTRSAFKEAPPPHRGVERSDSVAEGRIDIREEVVD